MLRLDRKTGISLLCLTAGVGLGLIVLIYKMNPPKPLTEAAVREEPLAPIEVPEAWQGYVDAGAKIIRDLDQAQHELLESVHKASASHDEDQQEVDDAWSKLPRANYDFIEKLSYSPDRLKVKWLFRHPKLNPQDTFIPKVLRNALGDIHRVGMQKFMEVAKISSTVSREEFFARKDQNQVRRVSIDELAKEHLYGPELAAFRADRAKGHLVYYPSFFPRDRQPARRTFEEDGTLLYAFPEDLPVTNELNKMKKHVKITLAAAVFAFFVEHAALPDHQQLRFLEQIADNIQL